MGWIMGSMLNIRSFELVPTKPRMQVFANVWPPHHCVTIGDMCQNEDKPCAHMSQNIKPQFASTQMHP